MSDPYIHPPDPAVDPGFAELVLSSHARIVGTSLVEFASSPVAVARWLYEDAPFGLLVHDLRPDPLFVYVNRTAQRCLEYEWAEIIGMPSRLWTEPGQRGDRQKLLDTVTARDFSEGYRGLRIAKSGRRFWVEDLTVWNLTDADGVRHGQAAVFRHWHDA